MEPDHADPRGCPHAEGRDRSVRLAGILGARLRAGAIGNGAAESGDAVLIDPERGFFAVGDSSDREPRTAGMFMRHFSGFLAGMSALSHGVLTDDLIDALQREIVFRSRDMLRDFPFRGTTTFTGVLLFRTGCRTRGILLHAGDSVLFSHPPQKGLRRMTKNNFWLLGKTREFYQAEPFEVAPGERFLFATDGIRDMSPPDGRGLDAFLPELFRRCPVEDIPDALIDSCDVEKDGRDDLAVMSLAPDKPFPKGPAILL
jgi:hypothetical protein